jgi:hypothetical protein
MASWILSIKVWLANDVYFIFLNLFCVSDKLLSLFNEDINVLYINFSKILEKKQVKWILVCNFRDFVLSLFLKHRLNQKNISLSETFWGFNIISLPFLKSIS